VRSTLLGEKLEPFGDGCQPSTHQQKNQDIITIILPVDSQLKLATPLF